MRDKFSGEAHELFASMGFYKKFADAGWRDFQKRQVEKQEDPGLADSILIPTTMGCSFKPIFIEHKTGEGKNRERFAFSKWGERQREFHVACAWSGLPYYLFLVMGNRVGGKEYGRIAFLMPGETMLEIERMADGRKSLSYATAIKLLEKERLLWTTGRWCIPEYNPMMELFRKGQNSPSEPPAVGKLAAFASDVYPKLVGSLPLTI